MATKTKKVARVHESGHMVRLPDAYKQVLEDLQMSHEFRAYGFTQLVQAGIESLCRESGHKSPGNWPKK